MAATREESTTWQRLFRRKPVDAFVSETRPDAEGGVLNRSIGLFQLTMFGVGATNGTDIFIVMTEAVPEVGPGVILSFFLAGITAALTAVCYAELASSIPVSGSSYSYTYATMGEIVAFLVAACLLLMIPRGAEVRLEETGDLPRVESGGRRERKEF